jgi:hypothetical protein
MLKNKKMIISVVFLLLMCYSSTGFSEDEVGIKLAWSTNIESDLAGYKVYSGLNSGNYDQAADVGDVTEFTLSGLEKGTVYYIAISAYDTSGNESGLSLEVNAVARDLSVPSAPANLKVIEGTTININIHISPKK